MRQGASIAPRFPTYTTYVSCWCRCPLQSCSMATKKPSRARVCRQAFWSGQVGSACYLPIILLSYCEMGFVGTIRRGLGAVESEGALLSCISMYLMVVYASLRFEDADPNARCRSILREAAVIGRAAADQTALTCNETGEHMLLTDDKASHCTKSSFILTFILLTWHSSRVHVVLEIRCCR
ncbi:hypothetical protein F4678DRAFT_433852, partial [Xylaria arbuscula]